jgi:Domain of unknown function (DUF2703)
MRRRMMSTVQPTPPSPEVDRIVAIDFLYGDVSSCRRCSGTDANLRAALAAVAGVLQATDARVQVRRIHVRSVEQARELQFVSSPTLRVNGRDIAPEGLESFCGGDGCGCAPDARCRVWRYRGGDHTEAPVGLLVDAILSGLYGSAPGGMPDSGSARVLAGTGAGAPARRCCG